MAKSAADLFSVLQRRYIKLERTSNRVGALHAKGKITSFDVEQIYSGVYLDAFVSLERFIEELFLGYVSGRVSSPTAAVKVTATIKPSSKAETVLVGDRSYLDWIPYDRHTMERAKIYFKNGLPFSSLDRTELALLADLHRIRNALAHRSDHSMEIFQRFVIGSLSLLPRDRRPGRFLLTAFRANPVQTRLQNYLFEMLSIAQKLSV